MSRIDDELKEHGLYKSARREKECEENRKNCRGYHGHDDIHLFYKLLEKFLNKNIGRPYEKVYGEFCAKWPQIIVGDVDTREAFRQYCFPRKHWQLNIYMVDANGNIKKNPEHWKNKHTKQKYLTLSYDGGTETKWEFNKKLLRYPEIHNYLYSKLGEYALLSIIKNNYLSAYELRQLRTNIGCNHDNKACYHRDDYFISSNEHYRECGYWIYRPVEVGRGKAVKIKVGGPEDRRRRADNAKTTAAIVRVNKQAKREVADRLLHDIEEERKRKLHETDLIDRDRLGFDENSFKGEYYHGQKRKKNKKKH